MNPYELGWRECRSHLNGLRMQRRQQILYWCGGFLLVLLVGVVRLGAIG